MYKSCYTLFIVVLGCGTGNYLVALSEFVGKVTGLELSEGMLKKAREKTAHLKNVEVMRGDITDMPYPDGHFDAICCNMVRHSIDRNVFQATLYINDGLTTPVSYALHL